jgi:hypothetical protein
VRVVRAFVLGAVGVGLLVYVAAAAVAVAAEAGARDLDARLGPVLLVAVEHVGNSSSLTLGPGLALVAVGGGLVNATAAVVIARRGGGADGVD